MGFTPAAWKSAPASRSRHQRQPSGVATRDPRHKPPSREPRNRSEPGARRTHRLRSRPPLLRVGFSTTASSSWRECRRRWRAQASGAPGPAAPPAGLATPLPGPTLTVLPGAPPRRRPCGTSSLRRPAPRALEADPASDCPKNPQDNHAHSERTGPVRLPTPDLGKERGPWKRPHTRPGSDMGALGLRA